jgi:hypothetical protein
MITGVPAATVRPVAYEVSCLPEGHPDAESFAVRVELRGPGSWAVVNHRWCYTATGDCDYEPHPSMRTKEWLAVHRYPLDAALELAKAVAPMVRVKDRSVVDVLGG